MSTIQSIVDRSRIQIVTLEASISEIREESHKQEEQHKQHRKELMKKVASMQQEFSEMQLDQAKMLRVLVKQSEAKFGMHSCMAEGNDDTEDNKLTCSAAGPRSTSPHDGIFRWDKLLNTSGSYWNISDNETRCRSGRDSLNSARRTAAGPPHDESSSDMSTAYAEMPTRNATRAPSMLNVVGGPLRCVASESSLLRYNAQSGLLADAACNQRSPRISPRLATRSPKGNMSPKGNTSPVSTLRSIPSASSLLGLQPQSPRQTPRISPAASPLLGHRTAKMDTGLALPKMDAHRNLSPRLVMAHRRSGEGAPPPSRREVGNSFSRPRQ